MATALEQMEVPRVYEALHTTPTGLSSTQAELRLREHGPNTLIVQRRRSQLMMFVSQFTDLLALLLIGAGVINLLLQNWVDAEVMFVIVGANAVIGYIQEHKAERILESLKRMLAPKARVLRDGSACEVDAAELVSGDIVLLEEGDSIPADLRLTEENELHTNDFALTGEASPKNKFVHPLPEPVALPKRDNHVYLGTTVARGNGRGVVVSTGMRTEIGRIAQLSQRTSEDLSPLQVEMNLLARRLTIMTMLLALILLGLSLFFLEGANLKARLYSGFVLAIGVAASCVPEGLPAQVSVALSLGVKRLAKKFALVKKLSSVETLGSTTVICTDKTGTITAGQMTVQRLWTIDAEAAVSGVGYVPEGEIRVVSGSLEGRRLENLLDIGPLSSTGDVRPPDDGHAAWYCLGDPTEGALVALGLKMKRDVPALRASNVEVRQFPFDSVRKRMSSVRRTPEGLTLYAKGASDSIIAKSSFIETAAGVRPLTDRDREELLRKVDAAAAESLRVLALAVRPLKSVPESIEEAEQELVIVGFVAMADPPREEVPAALAATRTAGIRTYILTGDAASTALSIAEKVGLTKNGEELPVIEGQELLSMADSGLQEILTKPAAIFCRVSPEDKLRIVELLKRHGEVVAVTGDGVNDAPALKSAAIGVAMGRTGTDVAKDAAEIILLDDSFATLVDAVREGRTIFRNLRKTVMSSLTSNGGELFATLFGFGIMALGTSQPILAVQILAIDLLAEMAPLTMLTLDPAPKEIMSEKPRARDEHLVSVKDLSAIFGWGAVMGFIAVTTHLLFLWGSGRGFTGIQHTDASLYLEATTVTYLTIGFCQYANILSRRWKESVFSRQTLENPTVLISMGITMSVVAAIMFTPVGPFLSLSSPPLWGWMLAFGGSLVYLMVWETKKLLVHRRAS